MEASIPANEQDRLAALRRFELLDTPPEDAFDHITRLAAKLLNVPIALVSLIDQDRQWFKSHLGLAVRETAREFAFCAHAIHGDDVFMVEDATLDPRFSDNPLVTEDPGIRFYAGAPLRTSDGLNLGTICVIDRVPRPVLAPDEQEALRNLSSMVMMLIEARQAVGYLHPVTGLSNRFRFLKDIDNVLKQDGPAASRTGVVVFDTAASDQYATLARSLGQVMADLFEVAAARRIGDALPGRPKLYHLSAARFGCILPLPDDAGLEPWLDAATAGLGAPILCQGVPIATSNGTGVALFPSDGANALELLRAATTAAHQAMEGKTPWCRYDAAQDHASQRAFHLLRDMVPAVAATDQFRIVYQPKIDLATRQCVGSEALLRWVHPDLGPISPAEFIPLAERTAFVRPITDWVLNVVLAQVAQWEKAGIRLRTSINLSMLDLEADDFSNRITALLDRYGVSPDLIDFEVTESALMKDRGKVNRQFKRIRQLGIEFEIDDFGTGQSALSYLKYIPASVVKIDKLFVQSLTTDRNDQIMVRSTIDLAHELGYRVVAEGIETAEVYDWLRAHGCDIGQGYLMSRPLEAPAFEAWLRAGGFSGQPQKTLCGANAGND
ncbi:putative bifunctional diguanylate cyclase/phosphodiesterase [Azospirillum doebereinerae]